MMGYMSYGFVLLIAAGLLVKKIVPSGWSRWVLLAMSLVFLAAAGGYQSFLFWGISTAAGYAAALLIEKYPSGCPDGTLSRNGDYPAGQERDKAGTLRKRRLVLILAVAFQLGLLAYFKYANLPFYTLEAIGEITGRVFEYEPKERLALFGISFYTLMVIGYDADVYRGEIRAVRHFPVFSLFTGYFGHLAQGPVDSYKETGESLAWPASPSFEDMQDGCLEILTGLFKKLILSERLALMADTVYGDYASYGGWYLMLAAAAFSLQLYTDFSGCMDLVFGVSRLFGVKIAENFRQPFFSESISEFWRRWHITLGAFLRKNVYIPLGGNRKGVFRKYVNVMAVFFLSGLWHGGKWTFIIGTGILQGAYMIGEETVRPLALSGCRAAGVDPGAPVLRWLRRIRTFVLVSAGFVLFRSDSLSMAGQVLIGMVQKSRYPEWESGVFYTGINVADFTVLAVGLVILFLMSLWREKHGDEKIIRGERLRTWSCFGILFLIMVFGWYGKGYDMGAFIYSQF